MARQFDPAAIAENAIGLFLEAKAISEIVAGVEADLSGKLDYEHTGALGEARLAVITLRRCVKKLHWIAGGRGYDNMGRRELEQVRTKADEAEFWLSAASASLNAGGQRARELGYGKES